jgi:pimeloyl-ACP methyl ester carboxylesterase
MPIPLILLPGLDGTGLLFQPFLAKLPPTLEPVVIRYPGDRALSYAELVPFVMQALPTSGPYLLLGESFSGPLAIMIASMRPPGLAGLILCATFVTSPWPILNPLIPIVARTLPFQLYFPYKWFKAWLGGYSTPEHQALLRQMRGLLRPGVMASRVRMVFRVDVLEQLKACDVATLYLQATKDILVPPWNLRMIERINPRVKVATIPSSHMVLQRHPTEAVEIICNFASTLGTSSSG